MSVGHTVLVTALRWATVLLLAGGLAATAHAQAPWLPWVKDKDKQEKQGKQDKDKQSKKDAPKDPAPAAKAPTPTTPQKTEKAEPKQGTTPSTVDSQADLAFWSSIKDQSKPEELRAYLKQFPNGRFAELARLRLKGLEGGTPNAGTGTAAAAVPDPTIIREVQTRLYNLNYPITRFDGSLDESTTQAIKAWQIKQRFAPLGVVTADELKLLRSTQYAAPWGAIAHPVNGTAAMVFGKVSRLEAESQALAECRNKNGGVPCKVYAAAATDCVAVAMYRFKGRDGQTSVSYIYARQTGMAASAQRALQGCNSHPFGGNRCVLVGGACGFSSATADQLIKTPGQPSVPSHPTVKQPMPAPVPVPMPIPIPKPKGREEET